MALRAAARESCTVYPTKVVLVEYYTGEASVGKIVRLRRQPNNLFGRTSIRVAVVYPFSTLSFPSPSPCPEDQKL